MKFKSILGAALLLFIVGCRSTKITDSWSEANTPSEHYQQIVVLAIVPSGNVQLRERLEAHMADDLCNIGYYALSAMDAYGKDAFCDMCESEILEKLKRDQVDAVVTIALVGRHEEKEYVRDKANQATGISHHRLYDYQRELAGQVDEPGYYVTKTMYYWQANLYRTSDQKLLYSARTETVDPGSADKFAHEYGRLILEDMIRLKVLEAPKVPNPFLQ